MVKLKYKLLLALVLLVSAVILVCLLPNILFHIRYDIEFNEDIGGYILTDIRINSGSEIELPDCTPDGKEISVQNHFFLKIIYFLIKKK